MPEFDLIGRIRDIVTVPCGPACVLGIGDDAAVLDVPPDRHLVVCTDTLVSGVHFPVGTLPEAIGHKALAVNLSDLAAMGAEPAWFFLALTLPDGDPAWVEDFARGLGALATDAGIALAGGDTTGGPLSITITALGTVEKGGALERGGAQPGDLVVVSGLPGRAALALRELKSGAEPAENELAALEYPVPRLGLGMALRGLATACIDLSDGLAADLGHILERSGAGASIDLAALPKDGALTGLSEQDRWSLQLTGGDDYELCFTVPPGRAKELPETAAHTGVPLTVIGRITEGVGLELRAPDGSRFEPGRAGYEHFSGENR